MENYVLSRNRPVDIDASKIKAIVYCQGGSIERSSPIDEFRHALSDPSNAVWIDLSDPTEQELLFCG